MGNLGEFGDVDDRQLVADTVALAERETALTAAKLAHLAEIEHRRLSMKLGASTVSRWWARGLRITQGAADRQIGIGQWLHEWPVVHHAFADAEVHLTHVNAIADGLSHVVAADSTLSDADRAAVVEDLLHVARDGTAHVVQRRAATLALSAAADVQRRARAAAEDQPPGDGRGADSSTPPEPPDPGSPPDDADDPSLPLPPPIPPAENADLNRLSIHPLANGRSQIEGNLDVALTDRLKSALAPHSAPRPKPNGERDPRSPAKRTADALSDVLDQRAGNGQRAGGGQRPVFAGIVDLTDLARRDPAEPEATTGTAPEATTGTAPEATTSTAPEATTSSAGHSTVPPAFTPPPPNLFRDEWPFQLAWGGPMSRALALLLTCGADMTPIVVDGAGVPLAMGRTERFVTPAQRTAVIVRDRCCVMCGRPAQWCDVHHLVHWAHGGNTDLDNEALLCRECHRLVHQQGWEIVLGEDRHPWIIPPASVDPLRQPRPSHHRRQRRKAA